MTFAVCIACGQYKDVAWRRCERCHLDPANDDSALIKSVYVSTARFSDTSQQASYISELKDLSLKMQNGLHPVYDTLELERLRRQRAIVTSVTNRDLVVFFSKLLMPAFIIIAIAIAITWIVKTLR